MKAAGEFRGPPATLTRMSNELPALWIVQILLREDPWPPPHVMWTWRLTVRWPVRQVVLFNMSVSWSNLRVWFCVSFSPSMHTYGQLNKVVSKCPLISCMQRKVSHACTNAASFWCCKEKQGGGMHQHLPTFCTVYNAVWSQCFSVLSWFRWAYTSNLRF